MTGVHRGFFVCHMILAIHPCLYAAREGAHIKKHSCTNRDYLARSAPCTNGIVETEICTYAQQHDDDIRVPGNMKVFLLLRHTQAGAVIVFTVFWAYFEYRFPVSRHASTVSQFICKIISRGNTCSKGMDGHKKLHYHIVTRKFVCKSARTRYRAYR